MLIVVKQALRFSEQWWTRKYRRKMCCSCYPLWDGACRPAAAHKFPRERLSQGGRWQLTSARPSPILPSTLLARLSYASALTGFALLLYIKVVKRLATEYPNVTNDTPTILENRSTG